MTLVLDANIAIALAVPLPYSNPARKALAGARRLIAPDLLVHETANVVSKLASANAGFGWESTLDHIHLLFDEFVPCRSLAKAAVRDAVSERHSAYDMFYHTFPKWHAV